MRFRHKFSADQYVDMFATFDWCTQQFGQPGWANSVWTYKHGTWHFRRREDYLLFVLKWI